jgi:hypothetical protein
MSEPWRDQSLKIGRGFGKERQVMHDRRKVQMKEWMLGQ